MALCCESTMANPSAETHGVYDKPCWCPADENDMPLFNACKDFQDDDTGRCGECHHTRACHDNP